MSVHGTSSAASGSNTWFQSNKLLSDTVKDRFWVTVIVMNQNYSHWEIGYFK